MSRPKLILIPLPFVNSGTFMVLWKKKGVIKEKELFVSSFRQTTKCNLNTCDVHLTFSGA
jgi:hypothetical protein